MDPMGIFSTSCSVHNFRTEIREMNNVEQQKTPVCGFAADLAIHQGNKRFMPGTPNNYFFVGCFSWMMNQIGLFRIPGVY